MIIHDLCRTKLFVVLDMEVNKYKYDNNIILGHDSINEKISTSYLTSWRVFEDVRGVLSRLNTIALMFHRNISITYILEKHFM